MEETPSQLRMTAYSSLFAASIAVGAFIAIPVGPVPIVLQNMFVLLAGLLLGPKWGLASVAVYLLAGAVGLPVFAGGTGGLGRILGPTGGYLISYLPAVLVVGLISGKPGLKSSNLSKKRMIFDLTAMVCGSVIIYAGGVPWLKFVTAMTWGKALSLGMLPFLIGDALKILAAIPIAKALRPIIAKL